MPQISESQTDHQPGLWRRLWDFIIHPVTLTALGILASILAAEFYYERGLSDATAKAMKEGRADGLAKGLEEGRKAFESNVSRLVEERYRVELTNATEAGRLAGLEQGRAESQEAARLLGYSEGRATAEQEFKLQRQTETHWTLYSDEVEKLARWAESLTVEPGHTGIEAEMLAEARALVEIAHEFKRAYSDKANAFNSIVEEVDKAARANNFPELRKAAIALGNAIDAKGKLFLDASGRIASATDRLMNLKNRT